jgi:hypothetical protein
MGTSPSIAPHGPEQDTYLVLDDFGRLGRAWRETDEYATDRETMIRDLVEGEFKNPVRTVTFNTAEGWCRDVTVDIADELRSHVVSTARYRSRLSNLWKPTDVEVAPSLSRLFHRVTICLVGADSRIAGSKEQRHVMA